MADEHLATYLKDHLAGSTGAIELLEHLETAYAGKPEGRILAEVRADVIADRRQLEALMARLDISEGRVRQAAAWLAEKAAELKLWLEDRAGGTLRLLEALDAVAVGIEGKWALWRSLAAAAENVPGLQGLDYEDLERRAEDQRGRVEAVRIEAARAALAPGS